MNRSTLIQAGLISLGAIAVYVGLRSIPIVDCGFLHYEPVEVTADGIEICANESVPLFLDLERLQFPVEARVIPASPLQPGEPTDFTLMLMTERGRPILPHELIVTHTELMHVLIIDPSLDDYHHVHPTPLGASGEWQFTLTPAMAGNYTVIVETVLQRTRRQIIARTQFDVPGEAAAPHFVHTSGEASLDGYTIRLTPERPPAARAEARMSLVVTRDDGSPLRLEPIMGAYAHMVAFDEQGRGFAHLHPFFTGNETHPTEPRLSFAMNTRQAGHYRIWAQLKLEGQERLIPFDLTFQ